MIRTALGGHRLGQGLAGEAGDQLHPAQPAHRGAVAGGGQALALLAGREYAIPEDVKYAAPYVLAHRIVPAGGNRAGTAERLVRELLDAVPVPLESV